LTDFESKLVAKTDENSLQKRSWTKIAEKHLQNAFQERQEAKKTPQGSGVAIKPERRATESVRVVTKRSPQAFQKIAKGRKNSQESF